MKKTIYIGIDPDIDKSGVAIWDNTTKEIELINLTLPVLIDTIDANIAKFEEWDTFVVIEKGEENKSIFHTLKNAKTAGAIGICVGKNFAVTKIIADFMECMHVKYEYFVPNKYTPKLNHKAAKAMFNFEGNKSNQEQRDALRCLSKYYRK